MSLTGVKPVMSGTKPEDSPPCLNWSSALELNETQEPFLNPTDYDDEEFLRYLWREYLHPKEYEWVLIAGYIIVFVVALIGNVLGESPRWHSSRGLLHPFTPVCKGSGDPSLPLGCKQRAPSSLSGGVPINRQTKSFLILPSWAKLCNCSFSIWEKRDRVSLASTQG